MRKLHNYAYEITSLVNSVLFCLCSPQQPSEISLLKILISCDSALVCMNQTLFEDRSIGINAPEFDRPRETPAQQSTDIIN